MTTAIIGVGNIGGSLARRLVGGGESVVLAARNESGLETRAREGGMNGKLVDIDQARAAVAAAKAAA